MRCSIRFFFRERVHLMSVKHVGSSKVFLYKDLYKGMLFKPSIIGDESDWKVPAASKAVRLERARASFCECCSKTMVSLLSRSKSLPAFSNSKLSSVTVCFCHTNCTFSLARLINVPAWQLVLLLLQEIHLFVGVETGQGRYNDCCESSTLVFIGRLSLFATNGITIVRRTFT